MVKEYKFIIIKINMKDYGKKDLKKVKELLLGLMEINLLGLGLMIKYLDMVF